MDKWCTNFSNIRIAQGGVSDLCIEFLKGCAMEMFDLGTVHKWCPNFRGGQWNLDILGQGGVKKIWMSEFPYQNLKRKICVLYTFPCSAITPSNCSKKFNPSWPLIDTYFKVFHMKIAHIDWQFYTAVQNTHQVASSLVTTAVI